MPTHSFADPSDDRYLLLQLADGTYLTAPGVASKALSTTGHCGDAACWAFQPAAGARKSHLRHHSGDVQLFGSIVAYTHGDENPLSDPVWEVLVPPELELPESWAGEGGTMRMRVTVQEGPARLPSEYLQELDTQGWVCCPSLLGERLLGRLRADISRMRADPRLREEAVQGAPGDSTLNDGAPCVTESPAKVELINCINESANFVRMGIHPVLLHMVESYIGTPSFRLAHSPAVGITKPQNLAQSDDGSSLATEIANGGGWHVDYPLHDMKAPFPKDAVLGLQANFCIDPFDVENSTNFKLGSHGTLMPPPTEFNSTGAQSSPNPHPILT